MADPGPDPDTDTGPDTVSNRNGQRVLLCAPGGPPLRTDRDATDVIGAALGQQVDVVAIPAQRLDDDFFNLSTRIAGEIVQKFVNYRLRLVIVGDISRHLDSSTALRDFVTESNRGRQTWFVADLAALDARLSS